MSNRINVNMTPNPSDIQTLHCSQGDTEERKFQFVFHNQGEVFDSENISDPVFTSFPVEVGGTEEIQPVNGTTPSTSPIIADITYPDGLREGEEFTYRESPTTISGNANFKAVYGNTLVWNQIAQLGAGVANVCTKSYDSATGITTITPTNYSSNNVGLYNLVPVSSLKTNHKYLVSVEANPTANLSFSFGFGSNLIIKSLTANSFQRISTILTWSASSLTLYARLVESGWASGTYQIKNVQCFDLTQMFGSGNEPTTVDEFISLFPLPYYSYDSNSLLSFNGTGIKTTGKNLLVPSTVTWSDVSYADGYYNVNVTTNSATERRLFGNWGIQNAVSLGLKSGTYIWNSERLGANTPTVSVRVSVHGTESYVGWTAGTSRYINSDDKFFILLYFGSAGTYNGKVGIQLEFGSTATSYEPYTETTTGLPISAYFPTGMKSAYDRRIGTVYDELTNAKAITRLGSVNVETLNLSASTNFFYTSNTQSLNIAKDRFIAFKSADANIVEVFCYSSNNQLRIYVNDVSQTLSGELYYELATPSETTILSASLVTENGEAPLYKNGDVLECECNENISSEPGFHVAKVKFTDGDGANYSNKIQIHVERSPQ